MDTPYDVVIIGGGPAGSAAATILARSGRKVVVLERDRFPRFKIGESLLPFSMETFERLGVREKLDARFIIKHGAEIVTSCGNHNIKFYFRDGLKNPHPTAYQVTRSEFDLLLLEHAQESGAEVRQETGAKKVDFDADGVNVTLDSGEVIRGRYVIDASGRQSLLGTQFGSKKAYANLRKFAVYAHYENVQREPGDAGTLIRIIRTVDGWFWMIPLTETRMSIGKVLEQADFKRAKLSPEAFLEAAIAEQPVVTERLKYAKRVTQVYAAGDYSYRNTRLTGERWILAGDAAGFIDPVFSTGVFMGLLSGEQAADAIGIALKTPQRALHHFQRYEKNLNKVMDLYLRFVTAWYKPEFIDIFVRPEERLMLPQAVNAVLSGNLGRIWSVRWRMEIFYLLVKIQKYFPIVPRLNLTPGEPKERRPLAPLPIQHETKEGAMLA